MSQSQQGKERSATEYLGLAKSVDARHPTDHPFRKPPLAPGQSVPLGNWVIVATVLLLPVWSYALLRSNVFGGVGKEGSSPALVDDFVAASQSLIVPSIRRPGNILVYLEAVMGIRMVSLPVPVLIKAY